MESKFDTVVGVFVSFYIGYPVVSYIMPAMSFRDYGALGDIFIDVVGNIKEWNRSLTPSLLFLCHSASAIQSSPL
jgi:hypothetical protein